MGCNGSTGFLGGDDSSNISPSDISDIEPLLACLLPVFFTFTVLTVKLPLVAGFANFVGLPNESICDFAKGLGID